MPSGSRFSNMIREHWKKHCPQMVSQLEQPNQLEQALAAAESRAADLLFQFLSMQKMQYQTAWDLAMRECLPQEEPSLSSNSRNEAQTETSD
jgi:hypothetical protein